VSENELVFSRSYDLPTAIVWDALIDEILVEGWLAPARIDPTIGGQYVLNWQLGTNPVRTRGVITELEPATRLGIDTDNIGRLEFILRVESGGTRGTATELVLRLTAGRGRRLPASTRGYWQGNLDQLEGLLRGHPVDWAVTGGERWQGWAEYLGASSAGG
jgi:uncharacterized protein YndB with AHSA1/START domain